MRPWGNNYSPDQMMKMVYVNGFEHRMGAGKDYAGEVLALIAVEKDPHELIKKIAALFEQVAECISIGRALDHLAWLYKCDTSLGLDYQRDGLDCLTYHLSGHQCREGIEALQAVLKRFKDDETKPEEAPREK